MADNIPNPADSPKNAEPSPADEAEIDRVLHEASAAARELQREVGVEPAALATDPIAAAESIGAVLADAEVQLAQVQEMLAEVTGRRTEFGGPGTPAPPSRDGGFTAEATVNEAEPPTIPTPSVPGPAAWGDGVLITADASLPPDIPHAPHQPTGSKASRVQPTSEVAISAAAGDRECLPSRSRPRAFRRVLGLPSRAFAESVNGCLALLDAVDALFSWVRYDVRRLLGWLGLAAVVAAISIFAHSRW